MPSLVMPCDHMFNSHVFNPHVIKAFYFATYTFIQNWKKPSLLSGVYISIVEKQFVGEYFEHNENKKKQTKIRGVSHCGLGQVTLKHILRQKKNYGNSNISPCKNTIFKKSSKRNQNLSRYYNSITNLKFQHKPKYHLSKILI